MYVQYRSKYNILTVTLYRDYSIACLALKSARCNKHGYKLCLHVCHIYIACHIYMCVISTCVSYLHALHHK